MARPTVLCDVDGVVADLMGGFSLWMSARGLPHLDTSKIKLFDIRKAAREPELIEIDDELRRFWTKSGAEGGLNGAFMHFMRSEDAYSWVPLVEGAREGIADLQEDFDVYFVTALMKIAPQHVPSKLCWMSDAFPSVKHFTAPSELKFMIKGDFGIDDRWDTCERWDTAGTTPLCFRQPWSEAPDNVMTFDWTNIGEMIREFAAT